MPDHPPPLSASTIALQIGIVLAIVLVNGFFVASEFALVSVRKTRIDQLAAEGNSSAAAVQRALRNVNLFIAATQIGVTLASLVLGSQGEKIFEPIFDALFKSMGLPASLLGVARVTIAAGFAYFVMTTMHVVIGELVPKSLAIQKTEAVALLLVRPMAIFSKIVTPVIWMLNGLSAALLKLLGLGGSGSGSGHAPVHSAEELDLLFTQSHEGGQLSTTEREILHRVVKFSDMTAREAMVPRVEMQGIPADITRAELMAIMHENPHTRMPIYRGSLDELLGIVHLKDLVRFTAPWGDSSDPLGAEGRKTVNLLPIVREAARVPETLTIDKLLVEFKRRREQMAIVIDEYGGTSGLITMGDLLQQVFGEVRDEFDEQEPQSVERTDGRVQLPGRVLIDEVNERYGIGFRDDEVDTLAGLVLNALGRPAVVGDEVVINGASIRVEEIDRLRITAVSLLPPGDRDDEDSKATSTLSG